MQAPNGHGCSAPEIYPGRPLFLVDIAEDFSAFSLCLLLESYILYESGCLRLSVQAPFCVSLAKGKPESMVL